MSCLSSLLLVRPEGIFSLCLAFFTECSGVGSGSPSEAVSVLESP